MKSAAFLVALMCMPAAPMLVCEEKPKAAEQKKTTALTEEEKAILKNRELLENLELLQSFEKVQYLDLFTDKDQKKEDSPAVPAKKRPGDNK
ncbi:MAG TPA: hypothetical protein VMG30_06420 [Acidobacteriota bacterium]|nr:hypothetical protein [Acidobacteriota bacterium]